MCLIGKPVDNQFNPSSEGTLGLLPKSTAPLLALLHNSSHPHQSICSQVPLLRGPQEPRSKC